MRFLIFISFLLLNTLACSSDDNSTGPEAEGPNTEEPNVEEGNAIDDGVMRNLSSNEIVADMGSGWNLGNSLDAEGENETVWGNPVTTKAMIDAIAERGFKTLRVPVTWRFHQGPAPAYTVEKEWLDRVQEVVDYGRANDMYVIINIHHDEPWIIPTYALANDVKDRLTGLWTQIGERFKDYSDYLIFETLNEPRHEGAPEEWSGGTTEGRDVVNQYHKVSVDAIRATGGNNAMRHLMVSTYAASTVPIAMDELIVPNNDERVIISIHMYFPYRFCLEGTQATWGTDTDKTDLDQEMDLIVEKFINKGRPVVLGEWSSGNQNNTDARITHASYYAQEAKKKGFATIWWDNGDGSAANNGSAIFDRNNLTWYFGEIADAVLNKD